MKIERVGSQTCGKGSGKVFTGIDRLAPELEPAHVPREKS